MMLDYSSILQQWSYMTRGENVNHPQLRNVIKNSWHRSKEYGLISSTPNFEILSADKLQECIIQQNEWFLEIAKAYVKKLYKLVAGSGFVITLCDRNGYLLDLIGDSNVIKYTEKLNFIPGSNWSESRMGTSGIGICLATKHPIQIEGPEHYLELCHPLTCSCAPLIDSNGQLLGALNMTADFNKAHLHTLGMVVAAGQAISQELDTKKAKMHFDVTEQYLQAVLDTVSEGIISVSQEGIVRYINSAAKQLLDISIEGDKPLPKETSTSLGLDKALATGQQVTNKEVGSGLSSKPEKLMVAIRPIRNDEAVIGAVMTLRKDYSIPKKINQTVGSNTHYIFTDILGDSASIKVALKLANYAAHFSSNVLLVGESGTGKEMFAQAIHNSSVRSQGPFVAINCAAIPRELAGCELFGYSDGAFTGARRSGSPGKFELAEGGTIFLDEIEDMPLEQQPVLLRVLEEQEVTRIGGQRSIPIDVRVIAATNQDLLNTINEKSFRVDLYYRLNVLCIKIPPLRERKGDISLLAQSFLCRFNEQLNVNAHFSKNVLQDMEYYNWPGNIRELQNVVQQAIFLSGGQTITSAHLNINNISGGSNVNCGESLLLKDNQLRSIKKALEISRGDVAEAARTLGISRTTIYRRIKNIDLNHIS